MDPIRIGIIGGGPGGLMTAYLLQRRAPLPFEITLFEASERLGGKVQTLRFEQAPLAYEAGAAELYDYSDTGPDPLREMVQEFGLTTRSMAGRACAIGDLLLKDEHALLQHFGQATFEAVREFTRRAKAMINPAEYYDSDWKQDNADPLASQKFSELLAEVPDPIARKYIAFTIHSDLATEPHQTSAMYGLANYLMNEPGYMRLYTIDGGIERLTQGLAERITANALLGQRVVRVERVGVVPDDTYTVTTRNRGGEETAYRDFDFVVVALPNDCIPAIDWAGETLSAAMHRHHAHYDYPAHYLRVTLLFRTPFWRDRLSGSYFMLDAFGGCCVYDETSRGNGDGNDVAFGVLSWLLAGEAALRMNNLDNDPLIARVLDSLPAVMRTAAREQFIEGRVHRWLGCVNGLPGGYPVREPDSRHVPEPENNPWLFVVGDYLFDSTLNGVLDSADTVAEWIVEEMDELKPAAAPVPATEREPAAGPNPIGAPE